MATILDVQKNEMELSLQQMQENSDRTRKIHKEVMQRLVHLQESMIKRVPWTANESGGEKSENLSSQLVSKPNLYFSHEYKPPPASSHVIHTLDTPQIPTSRQFCTSTNSVPYVFDKSSVSESVVNSVPPSVSPDDNTIFSGFQSFEKICEENSYVSMLPNFDGDNPRGWIIKARNYFKFKSKLDADMIRLAGLHFIGRDSTWYKWFYEMKNEKVEWKKFLHDLLVRFDDYEVDMCYLVNPLSIRQQGSVNEYVSEFLEAKEIAEYVYNFVFDEEILAHNFINGLNEEIRETIDLWSLKTFQGAVNWAKFQELQIEERLLFEASEEEYEMYEGMKWLFKETPAAGKAGGECAEVTNSFDDAGFFLGKVSGSSSYIKKNGVENGDKQIVVEVSCRRAINNIIVTFPSHFNELKRQARRAVDATSDSMLTTAAIACGSDKESRNIGKTSVLNFDPGGGTLHVSPHTIVCGIFRTKVHKVEHDFVTKCVEKQGRIVFSWTSIIGMYCDIGDYEKVVKLFYVMDKDEVGPDHFVFSKVELKDYRVGKGVCDYMLSIGFEGNLCVRSVLEIIAKYGRWDIPRRLMMKDGKAVNMWNMVVDSCVKQKEFKKFLWCIYDAGSLGTMASPTVLARRRLCYLPCDQLDATLHEGEHSANFSGVFLDKRIVDWFVLSFKIGKGVIILKIENVFPNLIKDIKDLVEKYRRKTVMLGVDEHLNFEVSTLLLLRGKITVVIMWFYDFCQHNVAYSKLVGSAQVIFLHWEWLSRQFLVFTELLETNTEATHINSNPTVSGTAEKPTEWEFYPSHYYQSAAQYLRKKRSDFSENGDSVVPSAYENQFPQLLEHGDTIGMQPLTDEEDTCYALSARLITEVVDLSRDLLLAMSRLLVDARKEEAVKHGWREIDGSITLLPYQQQTTGSNVLKLDDFSYVSLWYLLIGKMNFVGYWNDIILVFDPGAMTVATCKVYIKFDSSLRTRMFSRRGNCHEMD